MENFVTIFNKEFIPQGVAMYESMEEKINNFKLWIICVDQTTYDYFDNKNNSNVIPLNLKDFETEEMKAIKKQRSIGEYCWTLTPFTPKFVFDYDPSIERITYVDADLYFLRNTERIYKEFENSKKSVLITEHAFDAKNDNSRTNGRFCVQFIIFQKFGSEEVLNRWQNQCIDWCFSRYEDGKFGDQMYLDDWDSKYSDKVHVLKDKGAALAPWNSQRFSYSEGIFWHFHGLRFGKVFNKLLVSSSDYYIPKPARKNVYKPYKNKIKKTIYELENQGILLGSSHSILLSIFKRKSKRALKSFIELFF